MPMANAQASKALINWSLPGRYIIILDRVTSDVLPKGKVFKVLAPQVGGPHRNP